MENPHTEKWIPLCMNRHNHLFLALSPTSSSSHLTLLVPEKEAWINNETPQGHCLSDNTSKVTAGFGQDYAIIPQRNAATHTGQPTVITQLGNNRTITVSQAAEIQVAINYFLNHFLKRLFPWSPVIPITYRSAASTSKQNLLSMESVCLLVHSFKKKTSPSPCRESF